MNFGYWSGTLKIAAGKNGTFQQVTLGAAFLDNTYAICGAVTDHSCPVFPNSKTATSFNLMARNFSESATTTCNQVCYFCIGF